MLAYSNIGKYTTELTRALFLFCSFLLLVNIEAQQVNLDQTLSVNYKNIPIEKVLNDLTERSGIQFSYNPNAIPIENKINYTCSNKKLSLVLDEILSSVGIQYDLVGNYLVLKKASPESENPPEDKMKKFTVSGFISDAKNKEVLIGAAIYNPETGYGALTNNYGFFSLTLPEGVYTLEISYLGYSISSQTFELYSNKNWNVNLEPVPSLVEEVVITSVNREEIIFNSLAAQTNIKPFEVKQESSALGETDMLKSLDYLPGISFQSDGSSYFYVRGGNRDQNLILLDEAPLYNPSHMLGLFTPIIPDAVKTTNVYKADFPIQYGGRLSSVIDVRTRDGNKERFSGSASMGLVSTRFSVEGPIIKNASSYFVSYRRSYFGWLFKAADPNIKDFFFTDYTTKFNLKLSKKDRLFLTFYHGQDKFLALNPDSIKNGLEWSNVSLTLRWNHVFGERLFSNTTFNTSKYDYYLHTDFDNDLNWNSRINSSHLKSEFTYYMNPNNQLKFGVKVGGYFFNPGNYSDPNIAPKNTVSEVNSTEVILYAGNEHTIAERINVNYGLRLTHWSDVGEAYVVNYENYQSTGVTQYEKGYNYYTKNFWEPRISLSFKTNEYSSIKASYNRSIQNIHLINNSISPFNSLEVWLPSGPNIKPQFANIFDIGFIKAWPTKSIEFATDVYFKNLYNQIGYSYHSDMLLNPLIEGELRQGDGKAYGFELALKKTQGRFNYQLSYSYTRSLLKIAELNNNRTYKARQDKPIDLALSIGFYAKPRWLLSANFLYASGIMTTTPTGFYNYRGTQVPLYTEQNNQRMPTYKRLDIGSDFRLNKKADGPYEHHLIISFYNFLNFKNAAFLYFNKTTNENGDFVVPTDKTNSPEQISTYRFIYSIIPSVNYNLRF